MTPRERLAWAINQLAIAWVLIFGAVRLTALMTGSGAYGIDTRIYAEATRAWLGGVDPWDVRVAGIQYAAPPTSLLPLAPVVWLPDNTLVPLVGAICLAAAVLTIARSRAGWWWLLSVPVIEGVWVGSLDVVAVALLVGPPVLGGLALLGGLAPVAKLYAAVPLVLLGRARGILVAVAILAVTAPFLPWSTYVSRLPELVDVLLKQSGFGRGATAEPWLLAPTIVALVALGRRDGAWLAVPALWPASQLHYGVLAIPVGSPVFAAFAVAPLPAPFAFGVIALAVVRAIEGKLDPWSWLPARWRPARPTAATTDP